MADKTTNEELLEQARAASDAHAQSVGKGKPTPRRKEQEAARRRSLVVDPKSSSKERRERAREQRAKEQAALMSGDERHMPAEHRGPERRFMRDFVDARMGLGEFLLPVSFVFVIVSLFFNGNTAVGGWIILGFYALVFVTLGETLWAVRSLRKHLIAKFGDKPLPRAWRLYVIGRMLNLRRLRVPKPMVKRGEFPV